MDNDILTFIFKIIINCFNIITHIFCGFSIDLD